MLPAIVEHCACFPSLTTRALAPARRSQRCYVTFCKKHIGRDRTLLNSSRS
jgi:hypothetical protein